MERKEIEKDRIPNTQNLEKNLSTISYMFEKDYLHELNQNYSVVSFESYIDNGNNLDNQPKSKRISYESNIRALSVKRWVYDKNESTADKFKNILSSIAGNDSSVGFLLKRTPEVVKLFFVLKNETKLDSNKNPISRNADSNNNILLLKKSIKGNFNGTETELKSFQNASELFGEIKSISCLTNLISEKSEKYVSQGIEKLLDGIVPEESKDSYIILFLAEPINIVDVNSIKNGYEELASSLTPFCSYQYNVGKTTAENNTESLSLAHTEGINRSISRTHSFSSGISCKIPVEPVEISPSIGYSYSKSKIEGENLSDTQTKGKTFGISYGESENTTYTHKSYAISNLLEHLEYQIKRIDNGKALGMWKSATYVLSEDSQTSINVANFIKSLTQGDESHIEPPVINTWVCNEDDKKNIEFTNVKRFVENFTHPIFVNTYDWQNFQKENWFTLNSTNIAVVTPTCYVSTTELSELMSFPKKSVSGLPVIKCAEFGRDVISYNSDYKGSLELGCIYHMHRAFEKNSVFLNMQSLTSHTFITGSTGSGKSNTVFNLLKELTKDDKARFLVIEPAKGEYKNVFGKSAKVYGTNPKIMNLLKINPFAFPENIEVNEHIDRLIEIFNVCWPMYAAMPAILKDAVIRAYESAGWDIEISENRCNEILFPTFADVLEQIRFVLKESEYSADNKGDYTGALVTRVKSLTNGINGQIFTCNAISDTDIFDENVIIDLSRIGSTETKALIMGLLVMKLQEYRISNGNLDEKRLKHVTVLEEAHNLLKRTSTEQSSEGSNLLGKSVEMLANSIAELRAFGEGFIIADQSPGLLDMSVIRNTNTKIIHRLPDYSDRELVGKAAGLNDDQIIELAKLQLGVAAVYQNDWINPVLCKVNEFAQELKEKYIFIPNKLNNSADTEIKKSIADILLKPNEYIKFDEDKIINSSLNASAKYAVLNYLYDRTKQNSSGKADVALKVFGNTRIFEHIKNYSDIDRSTSILMGELNNIIQHYSEFEYQNLIALILRGQAERNIEFEILYKNYVAEINRLGGLK